jgi:hypothetical protein
VQVERGIFLVDRAAQVADIKRGLKRDSRPIRHAENEHNHEHFELTLSSDRKLNWELNYLLAVGVKHVWLEQLSTAFPDRGFVDSVINELFAPH